MSIENKIWKEMLKNELNNGETVVPPPPSSLEIEIDLVESEVNRLFDDVTIPYKLTLEDFIERAIETSKFGSTEGSKAWLQLAESAISKRF